MDHRLRVICNVEEAEEIRVQILNSAARTAAWIRDCADEPIGLLRKLRFELVGHDPLTGQSLNVVEQLNQMFTILATLRSVEHLLDMHPEAGGFRVALGTCSGRDIESLRRGQVAAEVFSASHPNSNRKLKKEIIRMERDSAEHRYVFFASPKFTVGRHQDLEIPGSQVQVYSTEPL